MHSRVILLALAMSAFATPVFAQAKSAHLSSAGTVAVDVEGRRHTSPKNPKKLAPWMQDRIKSVAPDYPYGERARRHEGTGYFQLSLDLKTGTATKVTVKKSTGFPVLDRCAVMALRAWRWRPGKWKEIETPVNFVLSRTEPRLPPGSVSLPLR